MAIRTTKYVPSIPDTYRANTERLTTDLQVVREARDLGQRNLPPTSAVSPTPPEERIVNTIQEKTGSLRASLRKAAQQAAAQLETMKPAAFDFEGEAAKLQNSLRDIATDNKIEVRRKIDAYKLSFQNLKRFRRDNNLLQPAIFSQSLMLPGLGLLAIFIIEFLVGFHLFAPVVNEPGLVFLFASAIPIVNILFAAILGGAGWRMTRHVLPTTRRWGWFICSVTFVTITLVSLVMAKYRQFYSLLTENSEQIGGPQFNSLASFLPNDLESMLLFFVGLTIPLLCAWIEFTGTPWSFFSQYVGYRRATEGEETAYENARVAFENFKAEVDDVFEAHRNGPGRELVEGHKRCKQMREMTNELNGYAEDIGNEAAKWSASGRELLNVFRSENRQMRQASSPAPAYFESFPDLSPMADVAVERETINATCQAAILSVEEFEALYREFSKALEQLKGSVLDDISAQYETALSDAVAAKDASFDGHAASATPFMQEAANSDAPKHFRRAS